MAAEFGDRRGSGAGHRGGSAFFGDPRATSGIHSLYPIVMPVVVREIFGVVVAGFGGLEVRDLARGSVSENSGVLLT